MGEDAVVPSPSSYHHHQLTHVNRTPVYARTTRVLDLLTSATTTPSPHPASSSSGYMSGGSSSGGGTTPQSRSIPVEIMSVFHSSSAAANSGGGGGDHDYGVASASSGLTPITPSPSTSHVGRQGSRPLFVTPGSEGSYSNSRARGGLLSSGGGKSLQTVKVGFS